MRNKIEVNSSNIKNFAEGYDEFVKWCKVRNLRPDTIKHYNDIVNYSWYKFFYYKSLIKDITQDTMYDFINFLRENRKQNDQTLSTNLRGMKTILRYFMKLGYLEQFNMPIIKIDKQIIETYSDEELLIMLEKPDLKKSSFVQYRNWVICNFLLGTGCRAGTLVNIKIKDIDFENGLVAYTHMKNRKAQYVPLSKTLAQVLLEYLRIRQGEDNDFLFCTAYGEKVATATLSKSILDYNRKKGINKTGLHRFRHTFAKKWILAGGDVFRLQKILCHSSMDIVRNYVNMFTTDLQKDFDEFNPLESVVPKSKTAIKIPNRRVKQC